MKVDIEEVWADQASQEKVEAILLNLPPLDQERQNVPRAAKDLREFAWVVSDEESRAPISRGAGQKELQKLARLCDQLVTHIRSMHELSLEHIVFPHGNYYVRESTTRKRLRFDGSTEVKKADRAAQENWENLICPSPIEVAEQLEKLSRTALDAVPAVVDFRAGKPPGRPRKRGALLVAEDAARTYKRMTGRSATITGPTGPGKAGGRFLAFLTDLLPALGISASPESLARRISKEPISSDERKEGQT